jgi:hypothetical protein
MVILHVSIKITRTFLMNKKEYRKKYVAKSYFKTETEIITSQLGLLILQNCHRFKK